MFGYDDLDNMPLIVSIPLAILLLTGLMMLFPWWAFIPPLIVIILGLASIITK